MDEVIVIHRAETGRKPTEKKTAFRAYRPKTKWSRIPSNCRLILG